MYGQGSQPSYPSQNPGYPNKDEHVPYGYPQGPQGAPPPYGYATTYPTQQPPVGVYTTGSYPGQQPSFAQSHAYPTGANIPVGQPQEPQESERPSNFGASFSDVNIRRAFVRKTYTILMCQLLVTLGFIILFVFCEPVNVFVRRNSWFYYLSYAVFIVTYFCLICCPGARRRFPLNLALLSIFTLAMSYMTATISCYHDTKIVLMAIGICAVVCLIISVGSAFCKFDVTRWGWLLAIAGFMLMLFFLVSLMFAFIPSLHTPWWHGIFSGLIALLFMGFLAYDTQMILGGRRYEVHPEEHIYAALQLYLDVVYIFLGILGISGASSGN
jgi:FtsH-binding integral membrane protein